MDENAKKDFIKYTTEGFPIKLNDNQVDEFLGLYVDYVNQSDNNFFAEAILGGAIIHAGMRTEVCKIMYDFVNSKIIVLTSLVNEDRFEEGEFSEFENKQILGMACMGLFTFCKTFKEMIMENAFSKQDTLPSEKIISNNIKYTPWSL